MPENPNVILSTAYFPPIQYYCKLMDYSQILIEKFENYSKQSYRNRCVVLAANGLINLTVPVQKEEVKKVIIKDICIDYTDDWQRLHLKTLESAYNSSPYYEFIINEFDAIFSTKTKYLFDLNNNINEIIFNILEFQPSILFSDAYSLNYHGFDDFRDSIHPKPRLQKLDEKFVAQPYWQVFDSKFGFQTNLSILDLIFCEGQNSLTILAESSIKSNKSINFD